MPVASGRIVKSRKGKATTPHKNTHRWESFSSKISKLHSLDPIRRVRRHDLEVEDLKSTTSYFRNGLDKWTDLNLSKPFTSFRREVLPLSDSLAQILHFENKIMDALATYISGQEKEALEPLLELLTAFAHDLGTRFEKHYARALALLIETASHRHDAQVTEWTFAALAFLFKYLSRLLAPDIRPTYDAMAPLLGKAKNPPHIARFAAEALSFLVSKAAAPSNRETSLPSLVEHAKKDLERIRDDRQYGLYFHGLMTMFAEASKGQAHGVHTCGPTILKSLISSVSDQEVCTSGSNSWSDLVCGVFVSIIHHADAGSFQPVPRMVYEERSLDETCAKEPLRNIIYLRIFGVMAGVRKGSRISDWQPLLGYLLNSLRSLSEDVNCLKGLQGSSIWQHILVNVAIIWNSAPMDSLLPHISGLTDLLTKDPLMGWFIPFCSYSSDLDATKFRSLFLSHFQKFIARHWSQDSNENMLCVLIPRMVESGALPSLSDSENFSLPQSWQDQIVAKFERLESSPFPEGASSDYDKDPKKWRDQCLPKYSALLKALECTTVRPSTNARIAELLLRKLKLALRPSMSLATDEARFIVSQGFSAYLRICKVTGLFDKSLGPLLRAAAPRYGRLTGFLEAMINYEEQLGAAPIDSESSGNSSPDTEQDPLLKALTSNLSSPSSALRQVSLRLLQRIESAPDQLDVLATMLQTEQTTFDLQNARAIAAHLRRLAMIQSQLSEESWLRGAVPVFFFGMLTVKIAPIWEAAVDGLKQIGQTNTGEEILCDYALDWLDAPSQRWQGPDTQQTTPAHSGLTDFECLHLMHLTNLATDANQAIEDATNIMLQSFEEAQRLIVEKPHNARTQALKVLTAAPNLAEKRSRRLVPVFLSWSSAEAEASDSPDEESKPEGGGSWSLADKKALLGVFALFTNPRVLYQSQKVYDALLGLLANGDVEVQKGALKALLAWKQDGVKPYQQSLEHLLEENKFKNELTSLFQGDNQIRREHRLDLMPVLLRLLYGRTISKKGIASGRGGLHATRLAVLRNLNTQDMAEFLNIALGDLRGIQVVTPGTDDVREDTLNREILPPRKQLGFLNMSLDMIHEFGSSVLPYIDGILNPVLYCLILACRRLHANDASDGDEEVVSEESGVQQASLLRAVRTTALKCVVSLLQNAPKFNWNPYKSVLIIKIVSPRLENLAIENAQGVSATLQLISTLSSMSAMALFLGIDDRVVPKLTEFLSLEKAKDEVQLFVLRIIRNLIQLAQAPATESEFNDLIKEELIEPNVDLILTRTGEVLKSGREIGRDLLGACVDSIVEISPIVEQSGNTAELIDISVYLLNQPARRVNPKVKGNVLQILEHFLQLEAGESDLALREKVYMTIASLFGFFKDGGSRQALCRVLSVYAARDTTLLRIADLCSELNSFIHNEIDRPNYEKRLAAFNDISRSDAAGFSAREWRPLLHNMLFYIKHDEEYGILSSNSADGICAFIRATAAAECEDSVQLRRLLSDDVLPSIYAASREPSDIVRRQIVRVLGYLVSQMPAWTPTSDLAGLDAPPDEKDSDLSFFSQIVSPATSRQMRALQLLSKANHRAELNSKNIAHFFIPLLEHFVFGREDGVDDHGVGAQATTTIADLAVSLEWPQYRAVIRRYIGYIESRPEAQKQILRILGKIVDSIAQAEQERAQSAMDVDDNAHASSPQKHRLSRTLPAPEKFHDDVVNQLLPPLLEYIHEKDEATVSSRVPVGVIIVKLLKLLPPELLERKLPGVLTDICHILRSKALEAREMARDTLTKMTSLLGASAFGFVLNELRGALGKGYQLHVLSYTMHSILVSVIPQFQPGDLDYCLETIMTVIMDDIFGAVGQEKDAEEYTNKMKEVKSSKSQDSMELVARAASVHSLYQLVSPLQALLLEKLDLRTVRKIDELLTRIANGLMSNAAAESRDTLVFCYEVIQKVYESEKPQAEPYLAPKLRRYLVQRGANKSGDRGTTTKYTHKLVRFAFDVMRAVLKKHDSLRTSTNLSGFVPIFGDAVVDGDEEVKIAVFKLLTVIVKVDFKNDDSTKLYKVALKEASKSIVQSTSTSADVAQTALKLISVILRDRYLDVPVKEIAIDMLLGKLKDDLTEPLYRHVTFNFLRSVLGRKVESALIYDTMDYVGDVMVTNDDENTRDLARGAFFQFLRDYPQKKNRWRKQLSFVVANLKYEREGGRLSVMEVIHLLLMKSALEFVQEVAGACFIPLVFVLANDDSEKCRLLAGELIKEIFQKADKERMSKFLTLLRDWLGQSDNVAVLRLALSSFGFYFQARDPSSKDKDDLDALIGQIVETLNEYSSFAREYELMETILHTIPTLVQKHPEIVLAREDLWHAIGKPLSSANPAVKLSGIKLLNIYLADFAKNAKIAGGDTVLLGSHGLTLEKDYVEALTVLAASIIGPVTVSRWRKRTLGQSSGAGSLNDVGADAIATADVDESLATEAANSLAILGGKLDPKPSSSDSSPGTGDGHAESDADEEEDEWNGVDEEPAVKVTLHTLFNFLSDILISETAARTAALVPKIKAMELLSHFTSSLPQSSLMPSLNILLFPLHHLTDPMITLPVSADDKFRLIYDGLRNRSQELMDSLQRIVGTEAYTREMLEIREAAKKRRDDRRRKRKIEAVVQPEKYGKWKRGKLDKKVKRRKERAGAERERRKGARY